VAIEVFSLAQDSSIATVDAGGTVSAVGEGQTLIRVSGGSVTSEPLLISVRMTENDIIKVLIEQPDQFEFTPGETIQLAATGWNVNDEQAMDVVITWRVDDTEVATIDNDGNFTAISEGTVNVIATIDGIDSEPFEFTIGSTDRTATFVGVSGYRAEGMATLSRSENGDVILEFSDDFTTDFALGTFIYLANTTNGRTVRSSGLDLGEIRSGGAKTFNVSSVQADVELDTYQYVIILCRPAGITFGFADFEN
ncbi:MAG: Ig-like domain-containing protein, partial [Bacteroidota bacterium]